MADELEADLVQRLLKKDLDEAGGVGRRLSSRARLTSRSVEAYLRAGDPPRWMRRLAEIDRGQRALVPPARARRRLALEHFPA